MSNREKLLKRVQVCDFVLNDTALYLDTHPKDQAALAYYKKYNQMRHEASKEYVENFGPLVREDGAGATWTWVDGLWPWQTEEEAK